ncbi:hypothetical protein [Endozoicomonas ascidiicola]|uniref:hypothetical protein n=1 Tax=Endozoicomonas ascidiicola TaxID=1698521 RepID=UPI0008311226|nr:hypothetical protein [Endozoicomonas ascidiicola]
MEGPSGKKGIQPELIDVPQQINKETSSSVSQDKEGASKQIPRDDSHFFSEDERKSISNYRVEKIDSKDNSNSLLSDSQVLSESVEDNSDAGEEYEDALNQMGAEVTNKAIAEALAELGPEGVAMMEAPSDMVLQNSESETPETPVSRSEKAQRLIRVNEKETVHKMATQLMQRAKTFMSGYSLRSQLGALNLSQAIKDFEKYGGGEAGELFEKMDNFAQILGAKTEKEIEITHHQDKSQARAEYDALALSFGLVKDIVKDFYFDYLGNECKQKLRDAFSRFENPSEESLLRVRGQASVDVNIAKLDAGVEVSTQLLGCDDTTIRLFDNQKFSLRLTVGIDLAKGYLTGAAGVIKGKEFNNIDEFIDYYGDSVLFALHTHKMPSKKSWDKIHQIKESRVLKKRIIENVSQLEEQFQVLGMSAVEEGKLKYGATAKAVPLAIKRETTEKQVGVRIAKSFGLDLTDTKWANTFTKKTPMLTQLSKHPEWFKDYDKYFYNMAITRDKKGYFDQLSVISEDSFSNAKSDGSTILSYDGASVIPLLGNRLEVLKSATNLKLKSGKRIQSGIVSKELSAMQDEVRQLIEQNYQEYKFYCSQVNTEKQLNSKKHHSEVTDILHRRGARKPPEMLQRFMVAHARLSSIYKQAEKLLPHVNSSGVNSEWLDFIEQDLSVPDIHVSQKNIEKYLMLNKQLHGSIKFNDKIAKLALGPFEGLVDVRRIKNRNEPNPDSDGDYLFVVLRGSFVGTASLAEGDLTESLTRLLGTLPSIDGEAPLMIDATSGAESLLQGAKHLKMELFFVKGEDGCYHQQYKRLLTGEELAVKQGGKVPITGMVSVSGQVAADHYAYHYKGEELGTNTVTYVQTRYNGWKIGQKAEKWQAFLENSNNKERLAKIMVNMASQDENAGHEFSGMKDIIKNHYQAVRDSQHGLAEDKTKAQTILDELENGVWDKCFSTLKGEYLTFYTSNLAFSDSGMSRKLQSGISKVSKKYSTLATATTINEREKFALRSTVKSNAFDSAIKAFEAVLLASHEPYLKETESRFEDVNPNQPTPYRKS